MPTVYVFLCILTTNGRYLEDSRFQIRPAVVTDHSTKRNTATFRGQQSGMSVHVYEFTRRHKPGDLNLDQHSCENLCSNYFCKRYFQRKHTEISFALRKIKSSRKPLLFSVKDGKGTGLRPSYRFAILYIYIYVCIYIYISSTESVPSLRCSTGRHL